MSSKNNSSTSSLVTSSLILADADNINYIAFGLPILIVNLLVFAIIFSDSVLLKRSALMAGIASGNLYLGLHMVMFGSYRFITGANFQMQPASLGECVAMIFPLFYAMAFNTEAIFLVLAGLERLLAIGTPNWFRLHWTHRNSWFVFVGGQATVLFLLLLGMFAPWTRSPHSWACGITSIFGGKYVLFLSGFSAAGGFVGAILTLGALAFGLQHYRKAPMTNGEASRMRRQLQLGKSMATISCFELAFMALPNVFSLIGNMGVVLPSFIRPQNSTYTNAINCMMLFVASMMFNHRFRKSAIILLHMKKFAQFMEKLGFKSWMKHTTVYPAGGQTITVTPRRKTLAALVDTDSG